MQAKEKPVPAWRRRGEPCECDPSVGAGERCSEKWARCNARARFFAADVKESA